MAQKRSVTPERQLLKLIEDPKGKNSATVKTNKIKRRNLSLFSFGAWLGRASFFRRRVKKWSKESKKSTFDIKAVNRILALCILILLGYFSWSFSMSVMNLEKEIDLGPQTGEIKATAEMPLTSKLKQSVSYYTDKKSITGWGFTPRVSPLFVKSQLKLNC